MGVLASGQSPPTADEIEACERHGGIEGVVPYSKGTSERRRKAGWYEPKDARPRWSKLPALVMCPTRELALQVRSHLAAAAEGLLVRVGAVVGGLSQVKQERVLAQRPDIIVATPGRLWEMHVQGAAYLSDLSRLQYLVLDEADRMVDRGRFQELASLLAEVNAPSKSLEQTYDSVLLAMQAERASKAASSGAGDDGGEAAGSDAEGDDEEDEGASDSDAPPASKKRRKGKAQKKKAKSRPQSQTRDTVLVDPPSGTRRRTFLFSATLAFAAAGTSSDMAETLVRAKLAARARADKRRAGTEGGGDLVAAQEGSRQADRVTKKARRKMLEEARRTSALVGLLRHVGASDHPAMVRVAKASEVEAASAVASEEAMESLAKISLQVGEDVILRGEHALKPLSELVNASEAEQAPTKQSARIADSSKGTSAAAAAAKKRTAASALTLPSSLKLAKMSVAEDEKDAALYYFLSNNPGRTLVFVNRIGMTRRLAGLLGLLRMPVHALHAKMQQRQRLKSLERFQREDGSVLVATDVAARGLDIPGVTHVVHYDVAIDPETFVHRSGRTARASREGQALTLVDPASHSRYVRCCLACGLEGGMDTMEVDSRFKRQVDDRVYAAAQVWKIESKKTRAATKASWVQRQAGAMDMDVDELTAKEAGLSTRAMEGDSESDDESKVMRSREAKKEAKALKRWKG